MRQNARRRSPLWQACGASEARSVSKDARTDQQVVRVAEILLCGLGVSMS